MNGYDMSVSTILLTIKAYRSDRHSLSAANLWSRSVHVFFCIRIHSVRRNFQVVFAFVVNSSKSNVSWLCMTNSHGTSLGMFEPSVCGQYFFSSWHWFISCIRINHELENFLIFAYRSSKNIYYSQSGPFFPKWKSAIHRCLNVVKLNEKCQVLLFPRHQVVLCCFICDAHIFSYFVALFTSLLVLMCIYMVYNFHRELFENTNNSNNFNRQ